MKFIGFIKEHHLPIIRGSERVTPNLETKLYEKYVLSKILDFLEGGVSIAVEMHVIFSFLDNKGICGMSYMTDGYWIWPSYLAHYLEHGKIVLNDNFIDYVLHANNNVHRSINSQIAGDHLSEYFQDYLTTL